MLYSVFCQSQDITRNSSKCPFVPFRWCFYTCLSSTSPDLRSYFFISSCSYLFHPFLPFFLPPHQLYSALIGFFPLLFYWNDQFFVFCYFHYMPVRPRPQSLLMCTFVSTFLLRIALYSHLEDHCLAFILFFFYLLFLYNIKSN